MSTQSRDVPSRISIPEGIDPQLRNCLEDVFRHLRGATLTTSGKSGKAQFRQDIDEDDRMAFQVWEGSKFERKASLDTEGRLRSGGVVVQSPNGTEWVINVADDGTLTAVEA